MKSGWKVEADASRDNLWRSMIFISFLAGAFLCRSFAVTAQGTESAVLLEALIFLLPLAMALLLSASVLGTALLPVCALALGVMSGNSAWQIAQDYLSGAGVNYKWLLVNGICVPAFFTVAVGGMKTSSMLCVMLDKYSVSSRATYNREYITMIFTVTAAVLAVYFITV